MINCYGVNEARQLMTSDLYLFVNWINIELVSIMPVIKFWEFLSVLIQHGRNQTGRKAIHDHKLELKNDCCILIGTLRSDDGDGNENAKKAIGLITKTTILHIHHAFLYISLPSLHDYDVKMPNFTLYRGSTHQRRRNLLFISELGYGS